MIDHLESDTAIESGMDCGCGNMDREAKSRETAFPLNPRSQSRFLEINVFTGPCKN